MQGSDQVQAQLKGIQGYVEGNKQAFKTAGIALTAFGAAITGVLALTVKAAIDEKESIARLSVALKNVGIDYNNVRVSIEQVIAAQVKKTNYSDGQQRDALQQLVLITGNYDLALRALPTVLDLAAAKQMDVSSAAVLMAKAMTGNTEALKRYGIEVPKDASASDVLNAILLKVKGTAEATANPFTILKNSLTSLAASIGTTILPTITSLVNWITNIVDWVKKWAEAHPALVRYVAIFAGTLGMLALGIGPLLIMIPSLTAGLRILTTAFFGVQAAAGPVGWALLGISVALSALMPFLIGGSSATNDLTKSMKDLEAQTLRTQIQQHYSAEEWANIKQAGYLTKQQFDELAISQGKTTKELYDQMAAARMFQDVWTTAGDTNYYLKETTEDVTRALEDQEDAERDLNRAASAALDLYMDKFQRAHDEKISALQDEYDAQIANIELELDATLSGYESQIDALYAQVDAIDKAQQKKRDDERKAQLEIAVAAATTDDERATAQKELDDFLAQLSDQQKKDEINAQIDTIRQEEANERAQAKDDERRAKETYKIKKDLLDDEYDDTVIFLKEQKALYDTAATEQNERYNADYAAFTKLLNEQELPLVQDFVNEVNRILDEIKDRTVYITYVASGGGGGEGACPAGGEVTPTPTPGGEETPGGEGGGGGGGRPNLEPYQYGGFINEPTLLTSLYTKQPYGIAGENGPEYISPSFPFVNIHIDEMSVRKQSDIDEIAEALVNKIRLRTGMKV